VASSWQSCHCSYADLSLYPQKAIQAEYLRHHTQSPTLPIPRVGEHCGEGAQRGIRGSEVVEVVGDGEEEEGCEKMDERHPLRP